jgi:hypothetical protein
MVEIVGAGIPPDVFLSFASMKKRNDGKIGLKKGKAGGNIQAFVGLNSPANACPGNYN